jgi:hypothetical protein
MVGKFNHILKTEKSLYVLIARDDSKQLIYKISMMLKHCPNKRPNIKYWKELVLESYKQERSFQLWLKEQNITLQKIQENLSEDLPNDLTFIIDEKVDPKNNWYVGIGYPFIYFSILYNVDNHVLSCYINQENIQDKYDIINKINDDFLPALKHGVSIFKGFSSSLDSNKLKFIKI